MIISPQDRDSIDPLIIDCIVSQGDNALDSVCAPVCLSVCYLFRSFVLHNKGPVIIYGPEGLGSNDFLQENINFSPTAIQ